MTLHRLACLFGYHRDALIHDRQERLFRDLVTGELSVMTWYTLAWECVDCRRSDYLGESAPVHTSSTSQEQAP